MEEPTESLLRLMLTRTDITCLRILPTTVTHIIVQYYFESIVLIIYLGFKIFQLYIYQNGWNLFQGFPGYIHRKHNFFEYRQWNNLLLKSSNIPAKAGISISAVFPYVPQCCVNIFLVHDFNSLNSSCFQDLFCRKSDTNLLTTNR